MIFKYSLNRSLIPALCFLMMAFYASQAHAQISGGEVKPKKEKKEKGEKREKTPSNFNADSLSGSTFYFTGLVQHSFRTFEDNSVYDVHAKLLDQMPMYTGGFNAGILMDLNDHFALDVGLTFFGHGEAYEYNDPDTDSSFMYTNVYNQVGIPLKLRYTYGNDFQFFGFAGLTPINILNINYESSYTFADGQPYENNLVRIKEGFTTFNVMFSGGLGMNYFFENVGLTLSAEYRRHLANTYSEDTFKRIHKMYGIGINAGLIFRM